MIKEATKYRCFEFDKNDVQVWMPEHDGSNREYSVLIRSAFMSNDPPYEILNIQEFMDMYPEECQSICDWYDEHTDRFGEIVE